MVENIYILASFMMTGIIWLIQIVHYPSFSFVDEKKFSKFHEFHSRSITYIVFPFMCLELFISGYFSFILYSFFWLAQFAIVVLLWLSTLCISVPIHNNLTNGTEKLREKNIKSLVKTNWIRTFLWSVKTLFIILHWRNGCL